MSKWDTIFKLFFFFYFFLTICDLMDRASDHMLAMRMINESHLQKRIVKSFKSYCGGIPSPESANNPLAYKFRYLLEWSVLLIYELWRLLIIKKRWIINKTAGEWINDITTHQCNGNGTEVYILSLYAYQNFGVVVPTFFQNKF